MSERAGEIDSARRGEGGWPKGAERPDTVKLYVRLVQARSRGQMQYKFSFAMLVANMIFVTIVDFVEILVIFGRIPTLAGWSLGEIAVLYGMAAISFAIAEMFSR